MAGAEEWQITDWILGWQSVPEMGFSPGTHAKMPMNGHESLWGI
jgi:hypothetical protein